MPYDSTTSEGDGAAKEIRRGPLRPARLASPRTRLKGESLARLVQLTDALGLVGLLVFLRASASGPETALLLLGATLLSALALFGLEAYQLSARERLHKHLCGVLGAVGASGLAMAALAALIPAENALSATRALINWCLAANALLCALHATWFLLLRRLRRAGALTPNVIIVGATPAAERLVTAALVSHELNILGIFDDRGARRPRDVFGVPVLGKTADVTGHRLLPFVDRIIVAVPSGATARIAQLIDQLAPAPNPVSLLVEGDGPFGESAAHERILDMPLAHLSGAHRAALQSALKRSVDVTLSIMAVIILAPVLAAIAVAIRLDSPGPVLFKQRRHGYLNEEVMVWKFRSMRVDAADATASRQVSANDDRVTRVGRFIRKTSLDELPQLWNVIRGEMSLVGPRPHAIGMLTGGAEASKLVESYAHRHRMKPGLTGWAAVNGSRGPVDTPEAVRRRVSLDLEYIERQSLWLDLAIIARTLPCVLGDTSAVR
jgi:Undecaprenyl-phosphate glucose phosphotransferase